MNRERYAPEKSPGLRNIGRAIEKSPELWIILTSITVALLVALFVYQFSNTDLAHFKDRTIGICAASGVDPNLRSAIFIKILFLSIFTFATVYILMSLFNHWLEKQGIYFRISIEKTAISILLGVGLINLILYIVTLNSAFKYSFQFLLFLAIYVLCLTVGRILVENRAAGRRRRRFSYAVFAAGFIIPYQLILGYTAFFEKKLTFGPAFFFKYILVWLSLYLLMKIIGGVSKKLRENEEVDIRKAIIRAGIPLVCLPAVIPLSNEIQYILVKYFFISPRSLSLAGILICVFVAAALFIYFLWKNRFHYQDRKVISNIYFPLIIAVDVLFVAHSHFIGMERIDLFHMGEGILPVQQLVHFNQIPYIDYQPPHGLFDIFPQLFFYLFNKNTTLDMFAWGNGYMVGWFTNIIAYLLLYALLKELTNPLFSLVIITCIPLSRVFDPYYTPIIIPGLLLLYSLRSPTFYRVTLFWLSVFFLVLWRMDFGIAVMGASFMMVAGISLTEYEFNHKRVIASFFTVFASASAVFLLIVFLKGKPLLELLSQLYAYIAIQVPSQSYAKVIKEYNYVAILQYVLFPAISVSYILFYFIRVFLLRKAFDNLRHILAFFAVVSLVMSLRSLHRHSLYEGTFAIYLYGFLLIFLPFYFYKISKRKTMPLFLIIALVSYFALPPFFPKFIYNISMKEGYPVFSLDKKVYAYHTWQEGERRVIISDPEYQKMLNATAFLDRHLERDQTFFDLSNAPLLYSFANRRHPAFIYESVYYTSENVQKHLVNNLQSQLKNNKLPLVVFKQNLSWDFYDFFPNEMRSYRVTEFIYNNYTPLLKVENYEIWVANTFDTSNLKKDVGKENGPTGPSGPKIKIIDQDAYKQGFSLRMLPYVWGTYDESGPAHNLKALFTFQDNIPCEITHSSPYLANFPAAVDKSKGNYLHLSMLTEKPASVKISYGRTSKNVIALALKPTGRAENYLVRISAQWAWMYQPVSSLTITASAPVVLQGVRILEGD